MFYYCGRKKKLAWLYPNPCHDVIIEPFAGSAAYSLHGDNWKKNVILVEKNPRIIKLWEWLIHSATPDDIMSIPELKDGDEVTNFLQILHAVGANMLNVRKKASRIMVVNWNRNRPIMAENLYKIKHWQIIGGDYSLSPDIEATWFIDPPYQKMIRRLYPDSDLDYRKLGEWAMSRRGQVICCEGVGADWLPFQNLTVLSGVSGKRSQELVWVK